MSKHNLLMHKLMVKLNETLLSRNEMNTVDLIDDAVDAHFLKEPLNRDKNVLKDKIAQIKLDAEEKLKQIEIDIESLGVAIKECKKNIKIERALTLIGEN